MPQTVGRPLVEPLDGGLLLRSDFPGVPDELGQPIRDARRRYGAGLLHTEHREPRHGIAFQRDVANPPLLRDALGDGHELLGNFNVFPLQLAEFLKPDAAKECEGQITA